MLASTADEGVTVRGSGGTPVERQGSFHDPEGTTNGKQETRRRVAALAKALGGGWNAEAPGVATAP